MAQLIASLRSMGSMVRDHTLTFPHIEERSETRKGEAKPAATRLLRTFLLTCTFLIPLTALPGLQQPFSRPQYVFLAVAVCVGLCGCMSQVKARWTSLPASFRFALVACAGALGASACRGEFASLESLLLPLLGVGWLFVLIGVRQSRHALSSTLVASGSAIAMLALAQYVGADPFAVMGWRPLTYGSERMRVYATLGNPNFVAAFLCGLLPLTLCLASQIRKYRSLLIALFCFQFMAIVATGSRAPILALAAVFLWMTALRWRTAVTVIGLAGLCVAGLALGLSNARNLSTTLRGRVYIWKVTAPHLAEPFFTGLGPGGFAAAFPGWETQYWQAAPDSARDRAFAGFQDHAHNDYLEIFADYGAVGLTSFIAILAIFLRAAWIRAKDDPLVAAASAGVVALMAVALVDFPLMRPAGVFLFWSLIGVGLMGHRQMAHSAGPLLKFHWMRRER